MTNDQCDPDSVAALIRTVGRRSAPPREDYERVLASSREAWQRSVRRHARRRWAYALAAGVALVTSALGLLRWLDTSAPHEAIGSLVRVSGGVFAGDVSGDQWRWITEGGEPVQAGARLRTDPSGRAAVALSESTSLRVAGSSDLLLHAGRLELLAGRLYLDTHDAGRSSIEVLTRFGTLRDIGTQFEVLATNSGLRVRTREGTVTLARPGSDERIECAASEELRVDAYGKVERGTIASHDADWAWAEALAEPPHDSPLPLLSFLEWVARETGRHLAYDSEETRARVSRVILHGTTRDLAPVAALEAALATTDFEYSLHDDGRLLLRLRHRNLGG